MSSLTLLALAQCLLLATSYGASLAKTDTKNDSVTTLLYSGTRDIISLGISKTFKNTTVQTGNHNTTTNEAIDKVLFFIEADINENGDRINHALFVIKDGVKTKLLDNARDIAVVNGSNPVYFGAKDGIYVYNEKNNKAEKYGNVNDDIVSIVPEIDGVIYYLNSQHQLYKVTEQGNEYSIADEVRNAQAISVDYTGCIYYYLEDKTFYVYDGHVVKQINEYIGNHSSVFFVKNAKFGNSTLGALVVGDGIIYNMLSNGTALPLGNFAQSRNVTAATILFEPELNLNFYYAENMKIYEFDLGKVIKMVLTAIVELISKQMENYFRMPEIFNSFVGKH